LQGLIDLYTVYLLCSTSQVSCTVLSEVLNGKVKHDSFTRLLPSSVLDSKYLWQIAKPVCKDITSEDAVLILDDSVEEKQYSSLNSLISYHFDHTGRSVKGVNFLSSLYYSQEVSVPVGVKFVLKDEAYQDNGQTKYKSSVSKNEHFRTLIQEAIHNDLPFRYVLNNSWFCNAENMKFIQTQAQKYFVMAMKDNRKSDCRSSGFKFGR
jgi:hypothetical protein